MSHRVLIVENHNLLREGLRSMIMRLPNYEVVGTARDGKEAIQNAVLLQPDLILMDLSMPGINGIEATAQIKRRMPNIRILALTGYKTDEYVREALRAGADGYALKDSSYEEFISAMDAVITGKKFICPDLSVQMIDIILRGDAEPAANAPWSTLTSRERSIIKLIAEGRTNRLAAEFLNISSKTVEKHRANLMHKLGLKNATELILFALNMGLIENKN
ncbi:response regulator [Glaciimonas immobilis]|uniref:DNA-binding NarL/FixJ family response regulator n=1 Tax=Glaciimonas immobilis TaxID=728004 RepID=A0A840RZQ0_9BURK|nr:response regulator transcription factor [Glaciimonas immobilis]KAF3996044.1 response regulator transcription factor [Glaciimonas immobilis]MBB5201829.1 DNA-binding NarL/FixJ family response regulator [Glaciimonas immobilis]